VGSGGGGGASGASGTGGAGGAGGTIVVTPVCSNADLNNDGVLDCHETLTVNATFDFDTSGWTPELGVTLSHASNEGAGSTQPGSLAVDFASTLGGNNVYQAGASQCIPLPSSGNYLFAAQSFIAPAQGSGSAALSLVFHSSLDCSGTATAVSQSSLMTSTGAWQNLSLNAQSPTGAQSAAVRLVVQKLGTQGPFTALFDNVLFKRQ
jgi:hypothetical protein